MIENLRLSLSDLLGADYTRAVCEARALLTGENPEALRALADEKIDWYPEAFARRQEELMERVGCRVTDGFAGVVAGSSSRSYRAAQHSGAAPLSGLGARPNACTSPPRASTTRFRWAIASPAMR